MRLKVGGPSIAAAHESQKVGGPRPTRPNSFRRLCWLYFCSILYRDRAARMFGASFLLTSSVSDRSTSGSVTSHGGVIPSRCPLTFVMSTFSKTGWLSQLAVCCCRWNGGSESSNDRRRHSWRCDSLFFSLWRRTWFAAIVVAVEGELLRTQPVGQLCCSEADVVAIAPQHSFNGSLLTG